MRNISFPDEQIGRKPMIQVRVLKRFCYYKARKVAEIAEYLGISNSTYLRNKILGNLETNGYLEKDKVSRSMFYKTNTDFVTLK